MELCDQVQADLKEAMKAGGLDRVRVLRSLLGAIGNAEAVALSEADGENIGLFSGERSRRRLTAEDVLGVVHSEIAERRVAIATYREIDRSDLAETMMTEIELLSSYLGESTPP